MIEVARADTLGAGARHDVAALLAHGFAEDFASISSDPRRLAAAFEHMVLLERFHVASLDGEPAGIATLTEGQQEVFAPRWPELRRHLGVVRGTIAYLVVRNAFMGGDPGAAPGRAEIGFVATSPAHQGRGVATALLRHLLDDPRYTVHLLRDIKDTNEAAFGLYRKLGFVEHSRRPARFTGRAGFSAYVSMVRETT